MYIYLIILLCILRIPQILNLTTEIIVYNNWNLKNNVSTHVLNLPIIIFKRLLLIILFIIDLLLILQFWKAVNAAGVN